MLVGNLKIEDDLCIKVFDPETKTLIAIYENYKEAGKKLGIDMKMVYTGCTSKTKRFSSKLNKKVALRLANKNTISNDNTVKSNNRC